MNTPRIKETRIWRSADVKSSCIKNELYMNGTNDEYYAMLDLVNDTEPTIENLYMVASDIAEHSDHQPISNIMFILENEVVYSVFDIEGEEI